MRRRIAILSLFALLALTPSANAASWALPQIRVVVGKGLMAPSVAEFRPNDPLTRKELAEIIVALTQKQQVVIDPNKPVSLRRLDAALVKAVGLGPAAARFRRVAYRAGLNPPGRFGTEVVARLLRLRYNHPAAQDSLELRPLDVVTRAETAYSLARIFALSSGDLAWANERAMSFSLPTFTTWQKRVLARAARFVGYPYVWGGMWEYRETLFGVTSRGGFDCSGFVWRVYKLQPFSGAPLLGTTIHGRTTYDMSGEIPRAQRVGFARLRPADLVFFGDAGTSSRPSQVGHMGMYLGRGWFIHSSSQGVTLAPLADWYRSSFAWGRRPLREVGLS
jgi:cell wall-associated NlpC family hydrolase